jgi:hypothetical protein
LLQDVTQSKVIPVSRDRAFTTKSLGTAKG